MISHIQKFIFIHIPKCAGSSIIKTVTSGPNPLWKLFQRRVHHEPLDSYRRAFPKEFDEYFKFSIVRNPWARVVSLYFFRKKRSAVPGVDVTLNWNGTRASPHWPSAELIAKTSFRETVLNSLNQTPEFSEMVPPKDVNETAWLEPACFPWITIDGKIGLDFVGKVETIQQDFGTICYKTGIPRLQLLHANKTHHKHYTEYYDNETREIVAKKYAKDIELFGYEFGD
jgi:hypothetical protein